MTILTSGSVQSMMMMMMMMMVLERYRTQVRVSDVFANRVYQYDRGKRDHHTLTLCARMKNNPTYTVGGNLSLLKQMLPQDSNYHIFVKASPDDLRENEKSAPVEFYMIPSLNIRKHTDEEQYLHAWHDGNDLTKLFSCIVSELHGRFYTDKRLIRRKAKPENLVANSIGGSICVRTENPYHRTPKTMYSRAERGVDRARRRVPGEEKS